MTEIINDVYAMYVYLKKRDNLSLLFFLLFEYLGLLNYVSGKTK